MTLPSPQGGQADDRELEPLAVQTVMTWTASASDSTRRAVTSASTSVSATASGPPSRKASRPATCPRPSRVDPCRSSATCSRSVRSRSPSGPARTLAATPLVVHTWASTSATEWVANCSDQIRGSPAGPPDRHRRRSRAHLHSSPRTMTGRRCGPDGDRTDGPGRAATTAFVGRPGSERRLPLSHDGRHTLVGQRRLQAGDLVVAVDEDGDVLRTYRSGGPSSPADGMVAWSSRSRTRATRSPSTARAPAATATSAGRLRVRLMPASMASRSDNAGKGVRLRPVDDHAGPGERPSPVGTGSTGRRRWLRPRGCRER